MESRIEPGEAPKRRLWTRVLPWCVAALTALVALSVVVPNVLEKFTHSGSDGGHHKCRTDLRNLRVALDEFAARHVGRYPAALTELLTPDTNGHRILNYTRIPLDPWKSPYLYIPPTTPGARPSVYSAGPDRLAGTSDDLRIDDE
jgi:hypothetical protein